MEEWEGKGSQGKDKEELEGKSENGKRKGRLGWGKAIWEG